jgi:hypothetical protein
MARTTRRSWLMKRYASWWRSCSSRSSVDDLRLHRHVERRGRLVEHHELGFSTSARAIAMRWRWPPENSCG